MDYLDFNVEISTGADGYSISVVDSPAGKVKGKMRLPFDNTALEKHLSKLQIAILTSASQMRGDFSPEEQSVKEFGHALFNTLFDGDIHDRYLKSLEIANNLDRGLRLKLSIKSPEIASLPWEFLYDSTEEEFVCLSRKTPIIRYIERESIESATPVTGSLRIFGVAPRYRGLAKLQVEKEQQLIEEAVKDLKSVELTWFEGLSWRELHREMEHGRPWHIFHFIGHGSFDEDTAQGTIHLIGDRGEPYHMTARDLSRILDGHSNTLRLAILNSCEGARVSNKDVFSSIAATLVRRSVPVALAMQYRISDWAAIEFARSFYTFVAEGLPVEAAVAEARKSISLAFYSTVEWGTPVLYMRSPHGQIFDVQPMRQQKQRREEIFYLYDEGRKYYKLRQWRAAWSYLNRIRESIGKYRDVDTLIDDIERKEAEEEIAHTINEARLLIDSGDWASATDKLQGLLDLYPDKAEAINLLDEVERQKSLDEMYREGQRQLAASAWEQALKCFEEIKAKDSNYKDVDDLMAQARAEQEQQKITELYYDVAQATDDENWDVVIKKLNEILALDSTQEKAQDWLHLAHQESELLNLYKEGLRLYHSDNLPEALTNFEAIFNKKEDYRNVSALIEEIKTKEEEAKRERELQKQATLNEAEHVFNAAQEECTAEKWLDAIKQLQALQISHPQLDEISNKQYLAQYELSSLEKQERIESLYNKGQEHYKAGDLSGAWACFNQIRDSVGSYQDVYTLLNRIEYSSLKKYRIKLIATIAATVLLFITDIISLTLLTRVVSLQIAQPLFAVVTAALTINLYLLYRLLRSGDGWYSEFKLLRSSPSNNHEKEMEAPSSSPEQHLSKRLKVLLAIDSLRKIDESNITCAEYKLFINEMAAQGKNYYPDHWPKWQNDRRDGQPVSGVRYADALAFCEWLTQREGGEILYRLPSSSEAITYPSRVSSVAAWCSDAGKYRLAGMVAINKEALRKQIKLLENPGIPMPPQLIRNLLVTHNFRNLQESIVLMPKALALYLGSGNYIAQMLAAELSDAIKLKFNSKDAHTLFVSLAHELNVKYSLKLMDENAKSLILFDDEILKRENVAKAKEIAEGLKGNSNKKVSRIIRLIICLLNIADSVTLTEQRKAQREFATLVLEYAFKAFPLLRENKIAELRRNYGRLKRLLMPKIILGGERRRLKVYKASISEFYWWLRIIAAREVDELPAWEGIRIVQESLGKPKE